MKSSIKKVYSFFMNSSVANPEFLIFFRVSLSLLLAIHFVAIWPDFELLYGENAIVPWDLHNIAGQRTILLKDILAVLQKTGLSYSQAIIFFKYSYLFFCVVIALGFFSRVAALLLLILQISFIKAGSEISYGVDYFCSISLVYIILFPSDDYYSLRNYFFANRAKANLTPFRRLFQIHICFAYFMSGIDKIAGFNWRNGESVWKAIHLPNFTNDFHINLDSLGRYPWIFVIVGWLTIITELLYPLFINLKKTRTAWLILTIGMHLSIFVLLNLYFFSLIMIIWNLTNYYFTDKKEKVV